MRRQREAIEADDGVGEFHETAPSKTVEQVQETVGQTGDAVQNSQSQSNEGIKEYTHLSNCNLILIDDTDLFFFENRDKTFTRAN